jgi:hypothetical protein
MKPPFLAKNVPAALLAGGLLLALAFAASAQPMYKWTDEKGRVTYSSTPPPGNIKAAPIELRGVETYQAGATQAPARSGSGGGVAPQPVGAAAGGGGEQAKAEAKKSSAATDPACADPRANCGRGEAPEFSYPDRTTERVRP